tara:strand:- start:4317 stop:4961 length:645 start_codon:yes stop_codon:yes gene_type:complete
MGRLTDDKPVHLDLDLYKIGSLTEGGGGYPLKANMQEEWVWASNVFSPSEIKTIIAIGESGELDKARTGGRNSDDNRNSFVHFIFPNDVTNWIYERLSAAVNELNDMYFGFDLFSFEQGLQFTRYEAPGQHYDWHIDRGMATGQRKMSLTVQLSDSEDYEGGDLQLRFGKEPIIGRRDLGTMTMFPSYTLHRVTPVTKGTRYSLVGWISGPPFK